MPARVFMSYSHKDEELRNELETHLSMLKNQGLIEAWHDRRLVSGDHLDDSIHAELEAADIILLLVSPDFLASDYCYRIEKGHALKRHRAGEARTISVILRPCEWGETELSQYLVTPKDGKAITRWADRDEAFLDVAKSIRRAVEEVNRASQPPEKKPIMVVHGKVEIPKLPRSSNMRLRKTFTDSDRDQFQDEGFDFIERFFRGSLEELAQRHGDVETRHRNIDNQSFVSTIYRNKQKVAACTIRMGGMLGGITYSNSDNARDNSFNESLSVDGDDQRLFFKPMGMAHLGDVGKEGALSHEGAAEYLWSLLITPLQGH